MADLEQAIREHAYHMWMAEGCPHGQCETLWLNAERHLMAERTATSSGKPATASVQKTVTKKNAGVGKKKRAA